MRSLRTNGRVDTFAGLIFGLLHEDQRLTGNLKPLAAARVLALHKVISPQQVRPGFGKLRPVTLISVAPQGLLLGPLNPLDLVGSRLAAVMAGKIDRF